MLYFYLQIPSEVNQPGQTSAIQRKAYPAEWDQNKAIINPQAFRPTTRKKSVLPFHSRQTTEWEHHTSVPQPQQDLVTYLLQATHTV